MYIVYWGEEQLISDPLSLTDLILEDGEHVTYVPFHEHGKFDNLFDKFDNFWHFCMNVLLQSWKVLMKRWQSFKRKRFPLCWVAGSVVVVFGGIVFLVDVFFVVFLQKLWVPTLMSGGSVIVPQCELLLRFLCTCSVQEWSTPGTHFCDTLFHLIKVTFLKSLLIFKP